MNEDLVKQLEDFVAPMLAEAGIDLVKLSLFNRGQEFVVTVVADKSCGGITMGECAALNRQLVARLEETKILGEGFSVELSSPGTDWPMTTRKDFLRAVGKDVRVLLGEPVAEKIEHAGLLARVEDDKIVLGYPLTVREQKMGKSLRELEIPINNVKKAVQII